MPCNPFSTKTRQIYIGGCFKFSPYILLSELNEQEEWEAWICLKEKIALVLINHGQKEVGKREDETPIIVWCKKTLCAIRDNDEEERTEFIANVYITPQQLPPDWDDWREAPYKWEVPQPDIREQESSSNICVDRHEGNKFINYLSDKDIFFSVKELDLTESKVLETSEDLNVNIDINKPIKEIENCELNLSRKVSAKVFGLNFSPRQLEEARIIGASGWIKL